MFYKNALLVLPQFFFAFVSLSSGQNFYYDMMYQSYNVFFTSLPVIVLGVFDQVSERAPRQALFYVPLGDRSPCTSGSLLALQAGAFVAQGGRKLGSFCLQYNGR